MCEPLYQALSESINMFMYSVTGPARDGGSWLVKLNLATDSFWVVVVRLLLQKKVPLGIFCEKNEWPWMLDQ